MKVLLLKDVAALGRRGDIREVKPGYARNFLLARGLAKPATEGARKEAELLLAQRESEKNAADVQFETALATLPAHAITLEAKATARGNLYRGIGKRQILAALEAAGISGITADDIQSEPLKKTGEHKISIQRGKKIGAITITIIAKK